MPKPSELPSSLEDITNRNAAQIDVGKDFHAHVDRLIPILETLLKPAHIGTKITPVPVNEQVVMGNPFITLQLEGTSEGSTPLSFNASEHRRILIGRDSNCDVRLGDEMVSRKHAMIIYDLSHGWILQDLSSTNGVSLNGTRVASKWLKVGDRIKLGSKEIIVCEATGPDSAS